MFGIKTTAKIGPLDLTAIISQEKGSTESASFEAGAAKTPNYKRDYDYLERTFFWLGPREELDTIAEILDARIYVFHQITSGAAGADTLETSVRTFSSTVWFRQRATHLAIRVWASMARVSPEMFWSPFFHISRPKFR